jgi:uridine kinase
LMLKPVVQVGLAGPSGSGKTAFSEKVQNFMPGVAASLVQSLSYVLMAHI